MINRVLTSAKNPNHETPESVLDLVRLLGPIAFDPCTTPANPTGALFCMFPPSDGLLADCPLDALTFVNPPFGSGIARKRRRGNKRRKRKVGRKPWEHTIEQWCSWVIAQAARGAELVFLGPGRIDTMWYGSLHDQAHAKLEWRGRITCKGSSSPAPFPITLFYFGPRPWLFCHFGSQRGRVQVLRERSVAR
jgi:hypothetical protein